MISILLPTRKRPHNLRRLIDSVYATTTRPLGKFQEVAEILCYIDDDDQSYDFNKFTEVKFFRGPRLIMSGLWNALIPRIHPDSTLLMMMADDVVFQTRGWNEMVEQAFRECHDKILLVHGDDLSEYGKTFATLPIVHRKWVETVGYFSGPGFSSDFADTWTNDVANMLGRRKYLPYVTEHRHWVWGKAEKDEVYREAQERNERDNPAKLYQDRLPERIADFEKLKMAMDSTWQLK